MGCIANSCCCRHPTNKVCFVCYHFRGVFIFCFHVVHVFLGRKITSTIRSNDWKLIYWYKDQQFELYNIKEDIGELNNLAESHPEKVKELAIKLGDHLRKVEAFRPTHKQTGDPAPWPDHAIR